jgi:hypothetical protein
VIIEQVRLVIQRALDAGLSLPPGMGLERVGHRGERIFHRYIVVVITLHYDTRYVLSSPNDHFVKLLSLLIL